MKITPRPAPEQGQPTGPPRDANRPSAFPARSLSPGELLKVRVVARGENGRVLLATERGDLVARTPLELAVGSEHWLEVRRGGGEPWLVPADRKAAVFELLRLLIAVEGGRGKALDLFCAEKAAWPPAPGGAASPLQEIASLLAESALSDADPAKVIFGLFLLAKASGTEKGAGGLRRRLTELLADVPADAAGRKEGEQLSRILTRVEQVNSLPAGEGERFLLVPCLLAGSAGWGEWLFMPPESGEEPPGEAGYELAFFLRLSRLGDLHLRLTVRGAAIRGTLAAATPEARRHLEANLPELTGVLAGLGFEQVELSCRLAERHLLQELQETLCRRAGLAPLSPLSLIDLQA